MESKQRDVNRFLKEAGLKVLAVAHLSQVQYSLMLYILNTAVSGLDSFVSNESELANLIGYTEEEVEEALRSLALRNLVKIRTGDHRQKERNSIQITLQYDLSRWEIDVHASSANSQDAVVFPFRRQGVANLRVLDGERQSRQDRTEAPTWQRIVDHFMAGQELNPDEHESATKDARVLVETHPVDQILILIRHFGSRIPTLSLLASAWHHFQELFEAETQKVDLLEARSKFHELDEKVRQSATSYLGEHRETLNADEKTVLEILMGHRHPRRQLFWAYQMRSRYANLNTFFEELASYMLPVTSGGNIVKRPPPNT